MRSGQTLWNRNFVAVSFNSCFLFMTFYILAVTLPIFVMNTMKGNEQQIGLVMTCFLIAVVIFRPLSGKWMDELNKKKIIFLSLALFLISTVIYTVIQNYYLLLGLRFLHGIGFGIAATATGAVAVDFIPEERKGEGIGYFNMFMSLAMVVGPFIGLTIMEHYGDFMVFGVCIFFALLPFLCGSMIKITEHSVKRKKEAISGWKKYVEPGAIPISLVGSMLAFSYGAITTFLSVYAANMGFGSYASYFFMVFAAMSKRLRFSLHPAIAGDWQPEPIFCCSIPATA